MSNPPIFKSSSNVFLWNIPLATWTAAAADVYICHQFEMKVPPSGKLVGWNIDIFPKGSKESGFQNAFISVALGPDIDHRVKRILEAEDNEEDLTKLQIEAAYWIGKRSDALDLDISRSARLEFFHCDVFKEFSYYWLGENYVVGTMDDLVVDGMMTFELEIKLFSVPRRKFQFSGHRLDYLNSYDKINRRDGDIKIICEGGEVLCHKFLLTSQSPVFKAMFEMESKEKKESVIAMEDCTYEVVSAFVTYLYDARTGSHNYSHENLEFIFGLLNLAKKYQVRGGLLSGCMDTLMDIMNTDNVLKIMAVADKFELGTDMIDDVTYYLKENIEAIVTNEDWAAFVRDFPSLVTEFVLTICKKE